MLSTSLLLCVLSGALDVGIFAIYNRQVLTGASRPNATTWSLWVFMTAVNGVSYLLMTDGDLVKSILPLTTMAAVFFTWGYSLFKGKFSKMTTWDGFTLLIGIAAVGTGWTLKSAVYANLILQLADIISFIPTYRDVWKDPQAERPLPWLLWSLTYVFTITIVLLRWTGQWEELVYPLNGFILHGIVAALSVRRCSSLRQTLLSSLLPRAGA